MSSPNTLLRAVALVSLSALTLSACAYGELRQVLRAQVASELDCPGVTVEPRNVAALKGTRDGDDQWKVRGCGVVRTYTCGAEGDDLVSYGSPGCTFVDGDVDAPELSTDDGGDLLDEPATGEE